MVGSRRGRHAVACGPLNARSGFGGDRRPPADSIQGPRRLMSGMAMEPGSPAEEGTPSARRRPIREQRLILISAAVALAIFAIGYWIPRYRFDEYLVAVVRPSLSWGELARLIVSADPAPGPWYLLTKPWAAISSDPAWMRIPSLISMAIAVAPLVAFMRRATDTRTALFAGVVALALPGTSRWAQDNRMYAAATAFLVLALLFWWISVTDGRRRWSVLYGAAVVGMALMHLYTLAWVPVLVVAAPFVPGPRRATLLRTLIPLAVALVIVTPHILLNLLHPTGAPANPPASIRSLVDMIAPNVGKVLGPLVAVLGVAGVLAAWRRPQARIVVVLGVAWLTLPLAMFIAARAVLHLPTLVDRYYGFALPGACILAALGLDAVAR